jgi:hypothetical protein
MTTFASVVRVGVLASFLVGRAAQAASPMKEECVDAHSKGQDARDGSQFTQAAKLFLVCAQPACPELVRNDCARFADELERLQPTVTFAARDGAQNDLLDTIVYVDGTLVASRLGDGRAHNVDPGRHEVRFLHAGKEVVVHVVVNQGEKGRPLIGTFATESTSGTGSGATPSGPELRRPGAPLALVGIGAAAAVIGGVVFGVGYLKIPSNCSLSTHQCAAPPGDSVFGKASTAVTMIDAGAVVGGVGLVALGGSLAWYFAQPLRPVKAALTRPAAPGLAFAPWVGPQGAGLSLSFSQ